MPFFAAILALQFTVLVQLRDWLSGVGGAELIAAAALLGIAGAATLAAVAFLALSVWPADFKYVAREPAFLGYAKLVLAAEEATGESEPSARALRAVKATLAEQYAFATDNNRRINQGRAAWRTRAGLATLLSVLLVLALVGLAVISSAYETTRPSRHTSADETERASHSVGISGPAQADQRAPAADGGGAQGVVEQQRD